MTSKHVRDKGFILWAIKHVKNLLSFCSGSCTVKPRPEAHMDMIPFLSVFEEHRLDSTTDITTALFIDNVIVLSDLVESSGYSSKTLQKGSCPYMRLWKRFYGMFDTDC